MASPSWSCELCSASIEDTRYRRNLSKSMMATAALNGLIATSSTGLSRAQLIPSEKVCVKCLNKLEKLKKTQATVDELSATFLGYLRDRAATLQSQVLSLSVVRKRSSAHFDAPVGSSTPKGRSPARKKPLVTLTQTSPLRGAADRSRHARKSLRFAPPHPSEQASPQVSVVETSQGETNTVRKMYPVTSSNLKRVTMHLAKGNYHSFAIIAMKIPRLKKEMIKAVAVEVRQECQALCSTLPGKKSVLRRTSAADLKIFQFNKVVDELSDRAPAFSAILEASVKRYRKQHTRNAVIPSIGFAAAILLRERNNLMCAAQCVNSILFHQGHASKMLYSRMKCMGVCLSHRSTLNALDKLGKYFDSHVHLWKENIAKTLLSIEGSDEYTLTQQQCVIDDSDIEDVIKSLQDLSVDQLQDSYRFEDEMEDVSAQLTTDHSDLQQLLINRTFSPYKIIGDNIDKKVKPRYMRVDSQSTMLNYFHIYSVKSRLFIDGPQVIQKGPGYGELLCLGLEDIMPTLADKQQLQENYIVLFARVICEYLPFFKKNFAECVPVHINHQYSQEMSQKSDVVPLGVLFHSEQYNDEMRDILKEVYQYVPTVSSIASSSGDEGNENSFPILFGGDQLTTERARTVKNVLSNSDAASSRLEALIPVTEDWHAKMCLYKVYWSAMYSCSSSQEGGTLYQLRNLIDRRNVIKDVRNDMNATEDFFEAVGISHIIAIALHHFNMKDAKSVPQDPLLDVDIHGLSKDQKWMLLHDLISPIISKYVSTSLECPYQQMTMPENFSVTVSDDKVFEYACSVLSAAMFVYEFDDGVRQGDGDRMYRVWKYLLLLFRQFGRTKYALEALTLQLQCNGLPQHVAADIKWSRFVNTKGGRGRNISCDLHMEHLNRELKTAISGLGANVTKKSISRSAKCLRTVLEVCDNFDSANNVSKPSGKHSHASLEKDMNLMVSELHLQSKVFKEIPGREHKSFPKICRNLFTTVDWNSLEEWFQKHKALFMEIHMEEDQDFMYDTNDKY